MIEPIFYWVAGALAVLVLGGLVLRARASRAEMGNGRTGRGVEALDTVIAWPPEPTRVLTAVERRVFQVLRDELPEYLVLAQVPLSRFLRVPTRHSYTEWMRRAGQLCADLVICDGNTQVIAVVDIRRLGSTPSERAAKRHGRMDRVLRAAGVRVLTWYEENLPPKERVRELVLGRAGMELAGREGGETISTRAADPREIVDRMEHETIPGVDEDAEPPTSTWFDDFDSNPVPLDAPTVPAPPPGSQPRRRP
ncbi:DUF2726 domain-containing protein [Rivibacter subsaxonicus]|uniref:Uncharacterized protein DUF2726 n=1 Tax=Rivibacter subsaxonicus TaxID=457575 RepID=A0A4Q7VGB2_9BURK|nr:DUF2726 domain-containing protein [Rivibacter subsaxonicus]RZT95062.1 uncharacterized protein DUF2726 [Rivibacter subsaxonicus]